MHNDIVQIGPQTDLGGIKGTSDIVAALKTIHAKGSPFVSRGDKSGTHSAERALWKATRLDPAGAKPAWCRAVGQSMGAALNTSAAMGADVLSDRGTWLSFKNKDALQIVVEGDNRLFNQYGIILVSPDRHNHIKKDFGRSFIERIVSKVGRTATAGYTTNCQQLFFPDAATATQ